MIRCLLESIFNHLKQGFRLFFAVNHPVSIKNLVAAVLRVCLGKHIEFRIGRIAAEFRECIRQIIDFIFRQRQPQRNIGFFQCRTALTREVNHGQRCRFMAGKQRLCL